jgi:hypothetical protein
VKCDRSKPCGTCTRIRSATCTYRSARAGIRERSPEVTSASASGSNGRDQDNSAPNLPRSSPRPYEPSKEFDLMVNRYVAPGVFGEHGNTKLKPLPASPTPGLISSLHTSEATLIAGLLKRIHSLEDKERVRDGRPGEITLPIRESSGVATGQFVKSKFYGQSHWVKCNRACKYICSCATCLTQRTRVVW